MTTPTIDELLQRIAKINHGDTPCSAGVADIVKVPGVLQSLFYAAYGRAARRAVALRLVADEDAAADAEVAS